MDKKPLILRHLSYKFKYMILFIIPYGGIVNMKYKGYRKIIIICMSIIFLCSGIVSCEAQINGNSALSSVIEPTITIGNGVHRYPFAKIGWNPSSTKLEIIDTVGIIGKLFHFAGFGFTTIGIDITFGMKLKVIEGTLTLTSPSGPIVNLYPGDTFQFHVLFDNTNNNNENWVSASSFMVTVETSEG